MDELEQRKQEAARLARFAKDKGVPCAFEVVRLARRTVEGEIFIVQPFGGHAIFKTHKLMHVEPIPADEAVTP